MNAQDLIDCLREIPDYDCMVVLAPNAETGKLVPVTGVVHDDRSIELQTDIDTDQQIFELLDDLGITPEQAAAGVQAVIDMKRLKGMQ